MIKVSRSLLYTIFIVYVSLFVGGCVSQSEYVKMENISESNLKKVGWNELEAFDDDNTDEAFYVFKKACQSPKSKMKNTCKLSNDTNNSKEFFKLNFTPYKLFDQENKDTGLITGYYEPLLYGSRTKSDKYQYPIYKTPKDLVVVDLVSAYPSLKGMVLRGKIDGNKLIPYPTRKEIDINNTFDTICYVDNKLELFSLHIQGSGKVKLDTNETINVGYDGQNGRKYLAIGGHLLKEGYLKKGDVSMKTIHKWLNENPEKIDDILNLNESYIFFNESSRSATGSLGVELVGGRNLAVDTKSIPLGYPVFLKTRNPLTKEKIEKLMIAADTGGAIKGKIRADFFFGFGDDAKNLAGNMKEQGEMYILVSNDTK